MNLRADFNNIFDDDYVWVSLRRVPTTEAAHLMAGETVTLVDEDGDTCLAIIKDRKGLTLTCYIDWNSWRSAVRSNFTVSGGSSSVGEVTPESIKLVS